MDDSGKLNFIATLDTTDLQAKAQQAQDAFARLGTTAEAEGDRIETVFSNIGKAIGTASSAAAAVNFTKQVFNVRTEMQNTEAMLRVFLGSAEKANAFFKDLQGAAYWNVFEFKDLAAQSAQLLAYKTNVEDVIPTLTKLSEIAAGTNTELEGLVSIYNKVKANDRLDSHAIISLGNKGIDVKQVLADIKSVETGQKVLRTEIDATALKFKDLEAVINHVSTDGGMFDGMMVEKMKTLGDTWGLMQDNLTNMFNEIGEATQDWLRSGMNVGNFLIENYQEVAKVLGILVAAYGATKAANIAMSIAQKNGTGIALINNTVWATRAKLLHDELKNGTNVTQSIRNIKKAQEEEIATLKASITEQQHAELIKQSRIANLDKILTQQQKKQLQELGISQTDEQYIPIASSLLDKEQQIALSKAELTNHNQQYIDSLKAVITANEEESKSIDGLIDAAQNHVNTLQEQYEAIGQQRDELADRVDVLTQLRDAELNNADGVREVVAQQKLEEAQEQLNTAETRLNTVAEQLNTAEKNLSTLQSRKKTLAQNAETIATQQSTLATRTYTTAKALAGKAIQAFTVSIKAMGAAIKANPIGFLVTAVLTLYNVISKLISKHKEEQEQQQANTKAVLEYNNEVGKELDRMNDLRTTMDHAEKGTRVYNEALRDLNKMCQEYNVTQFETNDTLQEQANKYANLQAAIEQATAARIKDKQIEAIRNTRNENDASTIEDFNDAMTKRKNRGTKALGKFFDSDDASNQRKRETFASLMQLKASGVAQGTLQRNKALQELYSALEKYSGTEVTRNAKVTINEYFDKLTQSASETAAEIKEVDEVLSEFGKTAQHQPEVFQTNAEKLAQYNEQLAEVRKQLKEKRKSDYKWSENEDAATELDNLEKQEKELLSKIKTISGKDDKKKSTKDPLAEAKKLIEQYRTAQKNYNQQLAEDARQLGYDVEQSRIDTMRDGLAKTLAQNALNHKKEQDQIEKLTQERIAKRKELALAEWLASHPDKADDTDAQQAFVNSLDYSISRLNTLANKLHQLSNGNVDLLSHPTTYGATPASVKSVSTADGSEVQILITPVLPDGTELTSAELDAYVSDVLAGSADILQADTKGIVINVGAGSEKGEEISRLQKEYSDLSQIHDAAQTSMAISDEAYQRANKQAFQDILDQVATYEERRLKIQKDYAAKRAELYEGDGITLKQGVQQEHVDNLNSQESDDLDALDNEIASREETFSAWVETLTTYGLEELEQMLTQAQAQLQAAEAAGKKGKELAQARASVTKLQNEIKKLKAQQDVAPKPKKNDIQQWKSLGNAIGSTSDILSDVADMMGEVRGASLKTIAGLMSSASSAISTITTTVEGAIAAETAAAVGGATAVSMVEKASVILTVISAVIQVISAVVNAIVASSDGAHDRKIEKAQAQVDALQESYDQLADAIDRAYSKDASNLIAQQNQLLEQQKAQYRLMIAEEKEKKKSDSDKIAEWEQTLRDIDKQIASNKEAAVDAVFGEDLQSAIENFADAYSEAWANGEDRAISAKDTVRKMMRQMVQESIKAAIQSGQKMQEIRAKLQAFYQDGVLTDDEQSTIESMAERLQQELDNQFDWAKNLLEDPSEREGGKKGIANASQESIDELNGRMTAVQGHTYSISENTILIQQNVAAINDNVAAIRIATEQTSDNVRRMSRTLDEMQMQGVRLRN